MAVYDLEEQEQISQLKGWWEENGVWLTTIITVVAVCVVSWQGWQWHKNSQAAAAGTLYYAVQQAAEQGDVARVRESAGQLIASYPGTTYAELAALVSARIQVQSSDLQNAEVQLQWVKDNGKDQVIRDIARLRLAVIALDKGEYKQGLAMLEGAATPGLQARFDDMRGDLLAADKQLEPAKAAYQAALDKLSTTASEGAMRSMVRLKLESLEG